MGVWLPQPLIADGSDPAAIVEGNELLRIGTLTLLEQLTPPQRAVLILRDAFGYPYGEVARILGVSESACRQHYSRARRHLDQDHKRFEARPEFHLRLLRRFASAANGSGMEELERLLADDVTVWADGGGKASAPRRPVFGKEQVARFIRGVVRVASATVTHRIVNVNGTPGLLRLNADVIEGAYAFEWTAAGLLRSVHAVRNPDKLPSAWFEAVAS